MITCRHLRKPPLPRVPNRPLPVDVREAIRQFPARELLVALTPFSSETLDRLAAGEPVRMSARMWSAVYQLAGIVLTRRLVLDEWGSEDAA